MAMAEALPVAGTVVPGSLVIIGLGALVPGGSLSLAPLLIFATLGAVTGDWLSYGLGRRFGDRIVRLWPLRRHPELITRGEALCRAHGGKAVFASRFVQGPRAFVPLAAGILGMPASHFLAVNLASALIWAPTHILAGALVGGSVALAGAVAGRLAALVVVAMVSVAALAWLAILALRWVSRRWTAAQPAMAAWVRRGDGWGRRQLAALLDPDRPEAQALALAALVLLVAAVLFFGILQDVVAGDPLVRADAAVYHLLQALRTPWADRVLIVVTEIGDSPVLIVVGLAVLGWLLVRRAWRTAAYWAGGLIGGGVLSSGLKAILHRPRPVALFAGWDSFSFPSGHATMNTVLWGLLVVLIGRELAPRWRPLVLGWAVGLVALIAFSRLYLGAHWMSDVAGGMTLGTAWVAVLAVAYLRHRPRPIGAAGLLGLTLAVFAAVGVWHVERAFTTDQRRYAVHETFVDVAANAWRAGAWERLPAHRVDLGGEREEPLVLQWDGDLGTLESTLAAAGWSPAAPWSVTTALGWLGSAPEARRLPVIPKLDDGRAPRLTMVLPAPQSPPGAFRLVLRLWRSNVRLRDPEGGRRPLWVGSVSAERRVAVPLLGTVTRTLPAVAGPRAALARALPADWVVVGVRRRAKGWDGRVLLVHPAAGRDQPVGAASGKKT